MSYRLYGTTDYYWTFYYMNDHIRRSGWPIAYNDLVSLAVELWPNQTLVTKDNISTTFLINSIVKDSITGAIGKIVARNLDLGQIVVQRVDGSGAPSTTVPLFSAGSIISYNDATLGVSVTTELTKVTAQYQSTHHYENAAGDHVDINPYSESGPPFTLTSKTNFDVLEQKNDSLKIINALSKESIGEVVGQWKSFMQNREQS